MTGRMYKQSLCICCSIIRGHAGAPKPTVAFPSSQQENSKDGAGASGTHLLGKRFWAPRNTLAEPRIWNAIKRTKADMQAICLVAPLHFLGLKHPYWEARDSATPGQEEGSSGLHVWKHTRPVCVAMLQRLKWPSRRQLLRCAEVCVHHEKVNGL